MFRYYNANPKKRDVNDCTIRAISLATGKSWDKTYEELSKFAQAQAILLDEVEYIDDYLLRNFSKVRTYKYQTVEDFVRSHNKGVFLITMNGHITCAINGYIYDTFDPSNRYIWCAYSVEDTF